MGDAPPAGRRPARHARDAAGRRAAADPLDLLRRRRRRRARSRRGGGRRRDPFRGRARGVRRRRRPVGRRAGPGRRAHRARVGRRLGPPPVDARGHRPYAPTPQGRAVRRSPTGLRAHGLRRRGRGACRAARAGPVRRRGRDVPGDRRRLLRSGACAHRPGARALASLRRRLSRLRLAGRRHRRLLPAHRARGRQARGARGGGARAPQPTHRARDQRPARGPVRPAPRGVAAARSPGDDPAPRYDAGARLGQDLSSATCTTTPCSWPSSWRSSAMRRTA